MCEHDVIMGVLKNSLQTWHLSDDSRLYSDGNEDEDQSKEGCWGREEDDDSVICCVVVCTLAVRF